MLGRKYIIKIRHNPMTEAIGIYFGMQDSEGFKVAKSVKLEYEKIDEGALDVEPTLTIPSYLGSDFLKTLLNAIENQGIKSESTSKTEGLLEATKYHLEDMRKIVFEKQERK